MEQTLTRFHKAVTFDQLLIELNAADNDVDAVQQINYIVGHPEEFVSKDGVNILQLLEKTKTKIKITV